MTAPIESGSGQVTRLYFGSAVVAGGTGKTGERRLGFIYRLLMGFHRLYSLALLSAAAAKLTRIRR